MSDQSVESKEELWLGELLGHALFIIGLALVVGVVGWHLVLPLTDFTSHWSMTPIGVGGGVCLFVGHHWVRVLGARRRNDGTNVS